MTAKATPVPGYRKPKDISQQNYGNCISCGTPGPRDRNGRCIGWEGACSNDTADDGVVGGPGDKTSIGQNGGLHGGSRSSTFNL